MSWDLVIRGGRVVDGTGMPAFAADVAIEASRIARIGRADGAARRSIDADGLVVAPGFIDVHTHYDAQLDWDPLATPSCFHGVTTIIAGNCGFTLAPAKPPDVSWLVALLTRVEGMSKAALAEGFRFEGGSFADYWQRFEGRLGVNAGGYVGHCAVRRYVMGEAASERAATGSSDAGAHLASSVGVDYTTRLLSDWVPEALSLEQAVWRLTGMPATVHGLAGRGYLRVGAWADLVLFDPCGLSAGEPRRVRDFPGDTERYVIDAEGYAMTIVSGAVVVEDGQPTGTHPDRVPRGG